MSSRRAEDWIDAFFNSLEAMAEALADDTKFRKGAGRMIEGPVFDMEAYRHRSEVWKRVRQELITFGFDVEEINFEGLEPSPSDPNRLQMNDPRGIRLYHTDEAQFPIHFKGDDAVVVKNFLEFYLSAYKQGTDPREYTQRLLLEQGITPENFHEHKDKLLINNPWE